MKGSDDGSDDGGASPAAGADASLLSTDPKVVETAAGSSDGSSSTERVLGGGAMAEGDLAAEAEMSVAAADVGESDAPAVKRRRTISKASSAAAAKDSIAKRRRPQRDRQPRAAKYNPSAPSAGAEAAAARAALAAKKRTAVEAARVAAEALGPPKDGDFAVAYNRSTRRWHATMTVYGKPWLIGGYGSEADAKYVCKPSVAKVLKDAAGAKKSRARNGQLPNVSVRERERESVCVCTRCRFSRRAVLSTIVSRAASLTPPSLSLSHTHTLTLPAPLPLSVRVMRKEFLCGRDSDGSIKRRYGGGQTISRVRVRRSCASSRRVASAVLQRTRTSRSSRPKVVRARWKQSSLRPPRSRSAPK